MTSFDLLTQRWIPCRFLGEDLPRDISLSEALARAPDIAMVDSASPIETVALHRLLLAILHRVFGPATDEEWGRLYASGRFDPGQLDGYLAAHGGAFDLFGDRPFYQCADLPETTATTVAKLGHEFAAGNNPILFDHSVDAEPTARPWAAAARLLVAQQSFAIGGLIGRMPGDPPSAEAAHLVKAAVLLHTGESLFETLMLNLVSREALFPFDPDKDVPAWEDGPSRPEARDPRGIVDVLTWQSRRVRLFADPDGESVSRVSIMAGYRFPPALAIWQREQMVAYKKIDKPTANQLPWIPVGFRPERALWRDSAALLSLSDDAPGAATTRWLSGLQLVGYLDPGQGLSMAAFGLSTDRAKVFLWRREDLPLPLVYLREPELVGELSKGVTAAEEAGRTLRRSVWILAEAVLAPGPGLSADRARVTALTDSLAPERAYWPALDVPFRRYMRDLADAFGTPAQLAVQTEWADEVERAARDAFESAARAVETSSRGYRAAAETRPGFGGQVARALANLRTPEEVPV